MFYRFNHCYHYYKSVTLDVEIRHEIYNTSNISVIMDPY
jgi:hypothetical protein